MRNVTHPSTKDREIREMSGLELKYFVLKPEGEDDYAAASKAAIRAYATRISSVNPELASDLRAWVDSLIFKQARQTVGEDDEC